MKLKDGYLALAVAVALGAPVAFAQSQLPSVTEERPAPEDDSGKTVSPAKDGDPISDPTAKYERSHEPSPAESSAATEAQMEQSASAAESQSASASQPMPPPSSEQSASMEPRDISQAQSDVPPPIDSETVRSIQQALSEQGQQVSADGIWGEKTHQALMEFQRQNNLDASGQLDAETFAALDLGAQSQTASAEEAQKQE